MTLLRAQFRQFVAGQIQAACPAVPVVQNRALASYAGALPVITLSTPGDHKQSMLRGGPQFTTTVLLEINARATASTDDLALQGLETLIERIETAVITNQAVIDLVQQFTTVRTDQKVSAANGTVIAEGLMQIECEFYQDYRDPPFIPLADIRATVTDQSPQLDPLATFDVALAAGAAMFVKPDPERTVAGSTRARDPSRVRSFGGELVDVAVRGAAPPHPPAHPVPTAWRCPKTPTGCAGCATATSCWPRAAGAGTRGCPADPGAGALGRQPEARRHEEHAA